MNKQEKAIAVKDSVATTRGVPATFEDLVRDELRAARAGHRNLNSAHEAYAVILEELEEFWEETRKRRSQRSPAAMLAELVQVAAMARRAAEDLGLLDAS